MLRPTFAFFFFGLILVSLTFAGYVQAQTPHISTISPTVLSEGMQVTVTGTGFGTAIGSITAQNRQAVIVNWTDTQIVATVTAGTSPGNLMVNRAGVWSNGVAFTMISPTVTSISPTVLARGYAGDYYGNKVWHVVGLGLDGEPTGRSALHS
jgi:hypothetical protein